MKAARTQESADLVAAQEREAGPGPDSPVKPQSPSALKAHHWRFVFKRALGQFSKDGGTDLAASLTYYAVLSLFPALIALVSLLGVLGQGEASVNEMLRIARDVAPSDAVETIEEPLRGLTSSSAVGFGLIVGLGAAIWSASGYIGAFGRALNKVYQVPEGRSFLKIRPLQLVLTLIILILVTLVLVSLVVTGPIAQSVGDLIGVGEEAVIVWGIVKWPFAGIVAVVIIALLYHWTPNVKQPKFRWVSPGAILALLVWMIASLGFGFYVANFGNYDKTYGALAGVIIFLLWIWITNIALLLGAEVDSELERVRELKAGLDAEETLQLPPKSTSKLEKDALKAEKGRLEAVALKPKKTESTPQGEKMKESNQPASKKVWRTAVKILVIAAALLKSKKVHGPILAAISKRQMKKLTR